MNDERRLPAPPANTDHSQRILALRTADLLAGRRLWAVFMLARSLEVAGSILAGRPVMVNTLDAEALRRARRGMPSPSPKTYIRVRHGHLDAITEAGPLTASTRRER